MDYKEEFTDIYKKYIVREGADKLFEYLIKSDFFTTPASAKYHCSHEGGLCEHSINVYKRLLAEVKTEYGEMYYNKYSDETIAISGLLHDICKIDYYAVEQRNVKVNGVWEQKPFYAIKEKLPYGHGEKSVYIVGGFIRLTREEAIAINWHMGGFDDRVKGGNHSVSEAFAKFPLSVLLHVADLSATYMDEARSDQDSI
ncbi:MAG: hydrolase [Clostridia bacterium]